MFLADAFVLCQYAPGLSSTPTSVQSLRTAYVCIRYAILLTSLLHAVDKMIVPDQRPQLPALRTQHTSELVYIV